MGQGGRRDPPGLRDGYGSADANFVLGTLQFDFSALAPGLLVEELRHLRTLSGACLTHQDEDVAVARSKRGLDLGAMLPDGEFLSRLEQLRVLVAVGAQLFLLVLPGQTWLATLRLCGCDIVGGY